MAAAGTTGQGLPLDPLSGHICALFICGGACKSIKNTSRHLETRAGGREAVNEGDPDRIDCLSLSTSASVSLSPLSPDGSWS
jgi:hypothetical protein